MQRSHILNNKHLNTDTNSYSFKAIAMLLLVSLVFINLHQHSIAEHSAENNQVCHFCNLSDSASNASIDIAVTIQPKANHCFNLTNQFYSNYSCHLYNSRAPPFYI